MSKVIIAFLILAFLVVFLLLFCIIVLTLALLIFTRKGKKGRTLRPEIGGT
ncbi:MAG: hypothetical protein WBN53_17145 [Thermodesulfobacteriota bacterium]